MRDHKAAVRFARAFFYEAQSRGVVEQAARDLTALGECVRRTPELLEFLANPLVPAETKKRFCREQLKDVVQPDQMLFLDLVIDRNRAALLPDILQRFKALVDDHLGIVRADVWSASPLTEEEQDRLRAVIAATFGGRPVLSVSVHPELVGGLRVRVKDMVVDGTFRTALKVLAADLKSGTPMCARPADEGPGD